MTNLIATVSLVLVTNWATVKTVYDSCNRQGCGVMHYNTLVQRGDVVTNKVATIEYGGKPFEIVLESFARASHTNEMREIPDNPYDLNKIVNIK